MTYLYIASDVHVLLCSLPINIYNIMISSLIVIPAYILEAKLNVIKQDYCPKFLLHN